MDKEISSLLELLENGQIALEGLVPWGSNYTFLVQIANGARDADAIYKPSDGERPLWDFARGTLSLRERAAFLVSTMIGWDFVPATVLREGPHGYGSVQFFVEHDPNMHYLAFNDEYRRRAGKIALFDAIINNADRKSGHVLLGNDGKIWAIDHGVSFHNEYKLKSVIWDNAGEVIPEQECSDLVKFQAAISHNHDPHWSELKSLLSRQEIQALKGRLDRLIKGGKYPQPGPGRHYPWPLV